MKRLITFKHLNPFDIAHIILFSISFYFFLAIGITTLIQNTHIMNNYMNFESNLLKNTSIIQVCLISPIIEEILHRKLILFELLYKNTKLKFIYCNILQAAIFACMHGNIVQASYAFMSGLVLGVIYMRYKTLIAPIIFHILINSISILFNSIDNLYIGSPLNICIFILSSVLILYEFYRLSSIELLPKNTFNYN